MSGVGVGDPATAPFERLSGGPRDSDERVGKQLLARLVSARAHVTARFGTTTTPKAASSGGGGGSSGGALARALLDESDDAEEAMTTTTPAPPPPPSPPARLKLALHERLQQLKDAIGEGTNKAERATATTTPPFDLALAARSRGRELLPERVAALLTSGDGTTPLAFVCPLTHEVMADPVVAPDGYTYERAAIEGHCERWASASSASASSSSLPKQQQPRRQTKRGAPPTSPMTGEPLPRAVALVPNRVLASMILEWGEREGRRRFAAAEAAPAPQGGSGDAAAP